MENLVAGGAIPSSAVQSASCSLHGGGPCAAGPSKQVQNSDDFIARPHTPANYYRKRNSDPKVFAVPPAPPAEETAEGWTRFLRAYRTGVWDASGVIPSSDDEEDEEEDVVTVRDVHGHSMSHKEYFDTYKHLAAPKLSPIRQRMRHEVLLRHGLTHAHLRPNLQRYVELAKRLFACDMVTLSFASADERHIIFIAADGPPLAQVPQCASICSHALLLQGENDIFLVPDMSRDWRFEHLFSESGIHKSLGYRFHASAPIFLSSSETPCCNIGMQPLHAGRFSIFGSKPRPDFNKEDCRLLLNLARMTEEGIEHEFLDWYVSKSRTLQHDTAEIFRTLDQLAEDRTDVRTTAQTAATAIESVSDQYTGPRRPRIRRNPTTTAAPIPQTDDLDQVNILCDAEVMRKIVSMVRQSLDASTVCIVDASEVDSAPPFLGWIASQSSSGSNPFDKKISGKAHSSSVSTVALSGDASLAPQLDGLASLAQLQSCFDFILSCGRQGLPQLFRRSILQDAAEEGLCPFNVHRGDNPDTSCCCRMLSGDMRNLLLPLLPDRVLSAFVVPIFANDIVAQKRTPLAMLFAIWDVERAINTGEVDFCTTLGIQLASIAIRDQANKIRRGQMDFLRTMQHELRTPLNGITCISEALCDKADESLDLTSTGDGKGWLTQVVPGGRNGSVKNRTLLEQLSVIEEKNTSSFTQVVRKAAIVLAPQLESIHISGLMLKTILDDILSFDTIFQTPGSSFSQKMLESNRGKQINLVDLGHEIEDVCREELRFFALQSLRTFRATNGDTPSTPLDVAEQQTATASSTTFSEAAKQVIQNQSTEMAQDAESVINDNKMTLPATMLVHIDPALKRQYRSDRLKLRKIVAKLVSNALRYTPPTGLIEVSVNPSSSTAAANHAIRSQRQGVKPRSPGSQDSEPKTDSTGEIHVGNDAHTWISITVKDSGIGMSDAFVTQKYLQPFNKADQFGQGIGLGATVACIMVQSLGGSFFVESGVNKGTEVSVFLPVADVADDVVLATALSERLKAVQKSEISSIARFVGFENAEGHVTLQHNLQEYLTTKRGFKILSEPDVGRASLLFIHESVLDRPTTNLPRELGHAGVYAIIVSQNPTNLQSDAECLALITQSPHAYFRPPFGPSAMVRLGELLDSMSEAEGYRAPVSQVEVNGDAKLVSKAADAVQVSQVQDVFAKERRRNDSVDLSSLQISTSLSSTSINTNDDGDRTQSDELIAKEISNTMDVQSPTSDDQNAFRVLVVEDNPINMRLITSLLRKLKLSFVEAHDGVEAVAQFKLFRPSVVLLDISLPILDGFGACMAMRAHALPFRPKIIAITALSSDEDKVRGINICGMDDWQTKPISIRMLRTNLGVWRDEWNVSQQTLVACSQQAALSTSTKAVGQTGPISATGEVKNFLVD